MESKYKLLVLLDLSKSASNVLKSAIVLAQKINAEITLFHVKKPTDVVIQDNQLSAVRAINSDYNTTDKKIKELINSMTKTYDAHVNYTFVIGNIKNEISRVIEKSQPDIIVLGKRLSKPFSFIGDNMVNFVLNKYKGVIMVAAGENALEPNKEISIGVLNSIEESFNVEFADDLMGHAQKPLKSFKIVNSAKILKEKQEPAGEKTIEYVFEQGDNAIKNLSNYLSKNNINLFCINRTNNSHLINFDLKDVIHNLNVSLLLTESQK